MIMNHDDNNEDIDDEDVEWEDMWWLGERVIRGGCDDGMNGRGEEWVYLGYLYRF